MQVNELRQRLKMVHGSMKRVSEKAQKSNAWVRLVLRGLEVDEGVIKAAVEVLNENKALLQVKNEHKANVEEMINVALASL
jgi:CO dehydrogenase/acetyl-CoA synthase gamma subunit (corrinoid Fe-S protein)